MAGRSAARLARLLGVQEVPGSNPGAPTIGTVFRPRRFPRSGVRLLPAHARLRVQGDNDASQESPLHHRRDVRRPHRRSLSRLPDDPPRQHPRDRTVPRQEGRRALRRVHQAGAGAHGPGGERLRLMGRHLRVRRRSRAVPGVHPVQHGRHDLREPEAQSDHHRRQGGADRIREGVRSAGEARDAGAAGDRPAPPGGGAALPLRGRAGRKVRGRPPARGAPARRGASHPPQR